MNDRVYAGSPVLLFVDLGVSGISPSPREVVKGGPAGSGPPFDHSGAVPPLMFLGATSPLIISKHPSHNTKNGCRLRDSRFIFI